MNKEAAARIAAVVRTTGLTPLQAALLVKAARDRAVASRMEKEAFLGAILRGAGAAGRSVRNLFGRTPPTPVRPSPLPTVPGRVPVAPATAPSGAAGAFGFSPKAQARTVDRALPAPAPAPRGFGAQAVRTGGILTGLAGVGGAGAVGAGHLHNDAQNTVGRSVNPLTWFGQPNTEEDVFRNNQAGYDAARSGIQGEMDAALTAGDHPKYEQLNDRFLRGDFGGSPWALGGLNPFASRTGAQHQRHMSAAQSALQAKYQGELGKSGPRPGDQQLMQAIERRMQDPGLLPAQAQAMERQLAALRTRLGQPTGQENDAARQIRVRMQLAGMRAPTAPGAAPAGGPPGGVPWNLSGQPAVPSYLRSLIAQPQDFRPLPREWDYQPPPSFPPGGRPA